MLHPEHRLFPRSKGKSLGYTYFVVSGMSRLTCCKVTEGEGRMDI